MVLCGVLLGFLWFWILHMLVGSPEGSPRAAREQLITSVSHQLHCLQHMINEQVVQCGSDSPVAQGQADISRGGGRAQTEGRPSKKQPHFRESVKSFLGI